MELHGPFLWAPFRCHPHCHVDSPVRARWLCCRQYLWLPFTVPVLLPSPAQSRCNCVPRPQPFLLAELVMAERGAAHGWGAEELGVRLVNLQFPNLTWTHWCTPGGENWQCGAMWNTAPAFAGRCFVFSEHRTLCRRCDKSLRISEEGQACRLKQEWPLWFTSSLIWRIKRCKSLSMLWGLED